MWSMGSQSRADTWNQEGVFSQTADRGKGLSRTAEWTRAEAEVFVSLADSGFVLPGSEAHGAPGSGRCGRYCFFLEASGRQV